MSAWKEFNMNKDEKPQTNKSTDGGKYLGVGKHVVRIDSLEQRESKNGIPFWKLTYVSEKNQVLTDILFPLYVDKETQQYKLSWKYKNLAHAILPDNNELRWTAFLASQGVIPANPELIESIVGLFIEIEVVPGKRGYGVKEDNGVYRLVDMSNGTFYKLDGGIPNEFESYSDAHETARDMGLYRAWNEVEKFHKVDGAIKDNEEVINKLVTEVVEGKSL